MRLRNLSAAAVLALLLILTPAVSAAPSGAAEAAVLTGSFTQDTVRSEPVSAGSFSGPVLSGSVMQDTAASEPAAAGSSSAGAAQLSASDRRVYDLLRARIEQTAKNGGSTVFSFTAEELGLRTRWTASELGISQVVSGGAITKEAEERMRSKLPVFTRAVHAALLNDLPLDLYWYDKSSGSTPYCDFTLQALDSQTLTISELNWRVTMRVCADCQYSGDSTRVRSMAQEVQQAEANAAAIVNRWKGKSDYEILHGYLTEVCDLTSYDYAATTGEPYGAAWQVLNVFDGDPSTSTVCEGFAKAFQYLCNLTWGDSGRVASRLCTGMMRGGTGAGNHMWNVVTLEGQNYLVDATNCDGTALGAPDQLFLAGTGSGVYEDTLTVALSRGNITYTWDEDTKSLWGQDLLTISPRKYSGGSASSQSLTVAQANSVYGSTLPDPVFTRPAGSGTAQIAYSGRNGTQYSGSSKPSNAGDYRVTVTCSAGGRTYEGSADFTISRLDLSGAVVLLDDTRLVYSGAPQTRGVSSVVAGGFTLAPGDYRVTGSSATDAGNYTLKVEGTGNCTGSVSKAFQIEKKPVTPVSASAVSRSWKENSLQVDISSVTFKESAPVPGAGEYSAAGLLPDDSEGANRTVSVTVTLTGTGDRNYTLTSDKVTATVSILPPGTLLTPAGAPAFTPVSSAGARLSDAALTVRADSFKAEGENVPGTVSWEMSPDTPVEQGKAYRWLFAPADTARFESASGFLVPWPDTAGTPRIHPGVSASGGQYSAEVTAAQGAELTAAAQEHSTLQSVIEPYLTQDAASVSFTIPSEVLQTLASVSTGGLRLEAPQMYLILPAAALEHLGSLAGNTVVTLQKSDSTWSAVITAGGIRQVTIPGGATVRIRWPGCGYGLTALETSGSGTSTVVRSSVPDVQYGFLSVPVSGSTELTAESRASSFADVPEGAWYADTVAFVSSHELMKGIGDGLFNPSGTTTRAETAALLYNLEGSPAAGAPVFQDTPEGAWYTSGITWAAGHGLVNGYGGGLFGPGDLVTREQMAVILYNYATYRNHPGSTPADALSAFPDAGQVHSWAREAMSWAVSSGLISGSDGQLKPQDLADRSQSAALIMRMCQYLAS